MSATDYPPAASATPAPASAPAPAHGTRPPVQRASIIAATEGGETAHAVLTVAKLLAAAPEEVQVVSVVEPSPVILAGAEVPVYLGDADEARARAVGDGLLRQVNSVFGEPMPGVAVMIGSPAMLLASAAREHRAQLVVCGLRHHGRLERMMLRRETPLAIARAARVPVLAVPEWTNALPRTVVVAADVDDASVHAARLARPLLAGAEKVYIVHVRAATEISGEEAAASWERYYTSVTQTTFDRITAALALPPGVAVETRTITGHAVEELLDFVEFVEAQLIVAGYRKRLFVDRLAGPRSVAERVFRATRCAMLLVPEAAGMPIPHALDATTEIIADRTTWAVQLAAFTDRNAGRRAHLEIDTIELGAQAEIAGYPLTAIEFDRVADVVRLMFGGGQSGAPHLSHAIPGAHTVEIQHQREGKDLALRVTHEGGYTLLTFRD